MLPAPRATSTSVRAARLPAARAAWSAPAGGVEQAAGEDRLREQLGFAAAEDVERGAVDGGDAAAEVGGDQAARDRLHDVAVEDLEVGQAVALLLELALGAA